MERIEAPRRARISTTQPARAASSVGAYMANTQDLPRWSSDAGAPSIVMGSEKGPERHRETNRSVQRAIDRRVTSEQRLRTWANTSASNRFVVTVRCGRGTTRGVRRSVGQQGRIGGGAHGTARRTCERGGLNSGLPCGGYCVGRVKIWVPAPNGMRRRKCCSSLLKRPWRHCTKKNVFAT